MKKKQHKKIKMSLCELELHNCVIHTTDIHKRCIQFPNTSVCLAKCMAVLIYYYYFIFIFIVFQLSIKVFVCFPAHYGFNFSIVLTGVSDVES